MDKWQERHEHSERLLRPRQQVLKNSKPPAVTEATKTAYVHQHSGDGDHNSKWMAPAIARRNEGVTIGNSDNERLTGGDSSGNNQSGAKKAATGSGSGNKQLAADRSGNNQAKSQPAVIEAVRAMWTNCAVKGDNERKTTKWIIS